MNRIHIREKIIIEPGYRQAYTPPARAGDSPLIQKHESTLLGLKKRQVVRPCRVRVRRVASPGGLTEIELLRLLQAQGIGRPATYAGIIELLLHRRYVARAEDSKLLVTERGEQVYAFLTKSYPEVFSPAFTARMECTLDAIANGKRPYRAVLAEFWQQLSKEET